MQVEMSGSNMNIHTPWVTLSFLVAGPSLWIDGPFSMERWPISRGRVARFAWNIHRATKPMHPCIILPASRISIMPYGWQQNLYAPFSTWNEQKPAGCAGRFLRVYVWINDCLVIICLLYYLLFYIRPHKSVPGGPQENSHVYQYINHRKPHRMMDKPGSPVYHIKQIRIGK